LLALQCLSHRPAYRAAVMFQISSFPVYWFADKNARRKRLGSASQCPPVRTPKVIKAGKQANGPTYQCQNGPCDGGSFLHYQHRARVPEVATRWSTCHEWSGIRDTLACCDGPRRQRIKEKPPRCNTSTRDVLSSSSRAVRVSSARAAEPMRCGSFVGTREKGHGGVACN